MRGSKSLVPTGQIEKARTLARKAMIGYEDENIVNYDETRFNPWANTNYSFQPTHSDGSAYARTEMDNKKSFTLLVGISASGRSLQPVFVLKNCPRGFKKSEFEIEIVDENIKARVSDGFFGIFLRFLDFFQAQIMPF